MRNMLIRRLTTLVCLFWVVTQVALAQDPLKVSGTVVDEMNEPVIGVSVLEKGTTNGTITDIDGQYSLSVKRGATIVFSYIGYATQEKQATSGVLNITLSEDRQALDEVVVVGYGVQKKSSVTGAISSVKSEDMLNRTITRPEQALQGKTAGVQIYNSSASPGASPTVRIRGISSNGDCDPLYVVDGRIMTDIGGLDPNDIESMEVLKDAASAAIYGAAAGNGVILITTKKGKAGQGTITYDFQLSLQKISNVPKVLNAEEYINYMTEANYISQDLIDTYWDGVTDTNWADETFETSLMQKHSLAFQGGNDKGSYYLSMSYLGNDGYIVGDQDIYKRITATINADYQIKPWLQVGTNTQIDYNYRKSVAEGSEYSSLLFSVLQLDPLTPVTYSADNLPSHMQSALEKGYTLLQAENGDYYSISPYQDTGQFNPFIMRDQSQTKENGYNINGTIYVNLTPFKDFTFTSRLGYRLTGANTYTVSNDYYVNATYNQLYMDVSASSSTPVYVQWENFANYSHSWGNHNMTAMLGMSFIEDRTFDVTGEVTGSDDDLGFTKDDPLYAYFDYATTSSVKSVSGGEELVERKLAYFGRLTYDYMGKYMAQFSLRADAADTSVLPVNQRWGYFPAVSLGWTTSSESFMEWSEDWLSHLKIRGSWGQNGTTASLSDYMYMTAITSDVSYPFSNEVSYSIGSVPSSSGNNDLKWETSEQIDLGLDARFFRDRLTFSFDWFLKKTKDLIVTDLTPSTIIGVTASPVNAGNVENKGVEIELGWQDNVGDFHYSVRGNIATLKNKVTYVHESMDRINGADFHSNTGITCFEEGYPAWYFRGYKVEGIDSETGDPIFMDLNDDGVINDSDRTMIGSGIPDFTYGITLTAAWKGLDLTVFGSGSQGNDIFACTTRGDRLTANILKIFYDDRWTTTNTDATQPRAGATDISKYWASDAVVFDGSYFKIKQIQLGYTLPKPIMNKIGLSNLRVYCSLDDFFTFTSYPGFDPEVTGSGEETGVDKGYYPSSKKVVLGLNVTF